VPQSQQEIAVPAPAVEPKQAAAAVGLRYVSDAHPGIRRRRAGKSFSYLTPEGARLGDPAALKRIRKLAVPPAWTDVWICPFADGHLQATGRDDRGRKQYKYHPRFREVRDSTKYEHAVAFAEALPALRAKVRRHMALAGLPRDKVLATVVYLLDKTLIRVGNDDYAKQNKSYGLTTLKNRHVAVNGAEVRFHFIGKSGKEWSAKLKDRRLARIIKACQDLPGQELLQYRDADGAIQDVTSGDVNDYLRQVTGRDVTAKDFRTWAGTVLAVTALRETEIVGGAAKPNKRLRAAIQQVAERLGNTPAICRKCYVHPDVVSAYLDGTLLRDVARHLPKPPRRRSAGALEPDEAAVLALLRSRLKASAPALNGAQRLRKQLSGSVAQLRRRKGRRRDATRHGVSRRRKIAHPPPRPASRAASQSS
jgi:DNA topoisomerase-1